MVENPQLDSFRLNRRTAYPRPMPPDGWLVVYHPDPKNRTRRNQLVQKLYGQVTYTNGRRYRRRGLLEGLGHNQIGGGIVVVRAEDGPQVVRLIRQWAKAVEWWPLSLRTQDRRRLTRPPSPRSQ